MKSLRIKNFFNFIAMFVLPFLLWVFIFYNFINGSITLNIDSYTFYSMFKFFYNNCFNGSIPIWDPFVELGTPYISIPFAGVLSPLMAIFACLHFVGVNYYAAYILFILFLFILGLTGFYLLALEILEDRFYAWVAFIALLFSGMGPMLFNQILIYYIFCGAVWMFYFLVRFSKGFELKYLIGMTVVLMNVLCFDYPFFFITLSLFFIIFFVMIFPAELMSFAKNLKSFILQHKKAVLACVLLVIFALMPLIIFKISFNGGDLLYLCRRNPALNVEISKSAFDQYSRSSMTFNEVSREGTFGERVTLGRLFSHLDKLSYSTDSYFYIPVFIYIILFISAFVPFGRRQLLLFCLGFGVFFLSLGQGAFLHRFLYDTVFYFKYFRNFFFFMAFLIPIIVLFAMFQLRELLVSSHDHEKRWQKVFINTFLHFCFLCLLFWQDNILLTTYLTVVASCILFNFLFLKPRLTKVFIFLLLILEPTQVYTSFATHSSGYSFSLPSAHAATPFNYERPSLGQTNPNNFFPEEKNYGNFWYDMAMQDSKGYIADDAMVVSKYTFLLSRTIDKNIFLNYIRHKFYIYDKVPDLKDIYKPSLFLSHDTEQFKVVGFSPNRLQLITDFKTAKFLVYTDSYEKHWKVFINGHEQKLYRANMAFKGVWLPAGRDRVDFNYSITGVQGLYLSIITLQTILLIYFIRTLCLK